MFVRFRRRRLSGAWKDEALEVLLVKNVRVGGKVKQTTLKYLGSIRRRRFDSPWRLTAFWRKALFALEQVEMSDGVRGLIVNRILERVPASQEMEEGRL